MAMDETTAQVIGVLEQVTKLMKLHGENPFKVRAFEKAQTLLESERGLKKRAEAGTLTELKGIGKGIAEVIEDFLIRGKTPLIKELEDSLPEGLLELTQISGLGPKKAIVLIEELGIKTLGELEYACRENRLTHLKGFGDKLQKQILEKIEFLNSQKGKLRLPDAIERADEILALLKKEFKGSEIEISGALKRRLEVIESFDFVIQANQKKSKAVSDFEKKNPGLPPIHLHFSNQKEFHYHVLKTSSSSEFWSALNKKNVKLKDQDYKSQTSLFKAYRYPLIPAELREESRVLELNQNDLDELLTEKKIRGVFHNHTQYSDGMATLEEMVIEAKKLGYEYIGISDHSQSAFYAQGLKKDALIEQEKELKAVQKKHPEIKIFWGIESDILKDGSLDYPESLLKRFDFVIASIHSRFQMNEEEMTKRIVSAICNPYTTMIGHLTGRLLLGRKAYPLDINKVISEAARKKVVIEINSHPARLDIDWRWGEALKKAKTWVSINPDAHQIEGLRDTQYGVTVARKALLPSSQVLNTMSAKEVEAWFKKRK